MSDISELPPLSSEQQAALAYLAANPGVATTGWWYFTPAEQEAIKAQLDPATVAMMDDPEIGALVKQAIDQGWDDDYLNQQIEKTKWWQDHSASELAWLAMKPGDQEAALDAYKAEVLKNLDGYTLDDATLVQLATQAAQNQWTATQLDQAVLHAVQQSPQWETMTDAEKEWVQMSPADQDAATDQAFSQMIQWAGEWNWKIAVQQGWHWNPYPFTDVMGELPQPDSKFLGVLHDLAAWVAKNGIPETEWGMYLNALTTDAQANGYYGQTQDENEYTLTFDENGKPKLSVTKPFKLLNLPQLDEQFSKMMGAWYNNMLANKLPDSGPTLESYDPKVVAARKLRDLAAQFGLKDTDLGGLVEQALGRWFGRMIQTGFTGAAGLIPDPNAQNIPGTGEEAATEAFLEAVKQIASTKYPALAAEFAAGRTLQEALAPYTQVVSEVLGLLPGQTVNWDDAKYAKVFSHDQSGARLLTLDEWARYLRTSPDFSWSTTDGAMRQAVDLFSAVAGLFGMGTGASTGSGGGGLGGLPVALPIYNGTDAREFVNVMLSAIGLGSLSGQVWTAIEAGKDMQTALYEVQGSDAFKQRFIGNTIRQQNGFTAYAPAEYLAWERAAQQLMSRAGIPSAVAADTGLLSNLIGHNWSLGELDATITNAYVEVAYGPPEVRQAAREMYGAQSDAALVALFLAPEKAQPELEKIAAAVKIGGTARQQGIGIARTEAETLASMGISEGEARQQFGLLAGLDAGRMFEETIGESTDLTAEVTGVEAQFGVNATAREQIEQRRNQRVAAFTAGGGAVTEREGVTGLGDA